MNFNCLQKVTVNGVQYGYCKDSFETFIYSKDGQYIGKFSGTFHNSQQVHNKLQKLLNEAENETYTLKIKKLQDGGYIAHIEYDGSAICSCLGVNRKSALSGLIQNLSSHF